MTAKSTAGSAKTSRTRKQRSNPKTELTAVEAVANTQADNDQSEGVTQDAAASSSRKAVPASRRRTTRTAATKATASKATKAATVARKAEKKTAPVTGPAETGTENPPVKRGRGRPRKNPIAAAPVESAVPEHVTAGNAATETAATEPRTRPEKPRRGPKSGTTRKAVVGKPAEIVETAELTEADTAIAVDTVKADTPVSSEASQSPVRRAGRSSHKTRAARSKPVAETAAQGEAPETGLSEQMESPDATNQPVAETRTRAPRHRRKHGDKTAPEAAQVAPDISALNAEKNAAQSRDVPSQESVTPDESATAPRTDAAARIADETPRVLFSDLGLSAPIMRAIEEMGYEHPTPIQARAIPVVLNGQDVLGVAQTGTGKTASFTLPMLEKLAGSRARARMPRSLILEPTRELALQVAENLTLYGKHLRLNHALLIGGESMADQRAVLNQGVDVLIATPGRLMDLFDRGGLLLTQTGILVIDEADRMLDMGFIPDITRIVSMLPVHRQTLLFSATMAPEIRTLADQFLHLPEEITVSRPSSVATTIEEALLVVDEHDKRRVLRKLLKRENVQNAIVFCNRKRDVDVLYKSLHKHGFAVGHLHGDLAQSLRFKTLERFKAGELRILVCSDVAARGIDIGGLSHVFNFDLPFNAEDYIHRIGRTGRAGKTGHAFSLATPRQKLLAEAIEKLKHAPIPLTTLDGIETLPWADPEEENTPPERRERRGKDRGGRHNNRHGETRDRDRDRDRDRVSTAETRSQTPPRPNTGESGSVAPTMAFDHDAPRTGFGHETPAFMLLPRRNRKAEPEDHVGPIQHRGTV